VPATKVSLYTDRPALADLCSTITKANSLEKNDSILGGHHRCHNLHACGKIVFANAPHNDEIILHEYPGE
jgi:hypothetical protein